MCQTLGRANRTHHKEKAMNEMTQVISEVKTQVSRKEWEQRILACRQSGTSVRNWCLENGVLPPALITTICEKYEKVC